MAVKRNGLGVAPDMQSSYEAFPACPKVQKIPFVDPVNFADNDVFTPMHSFYLYAAACHTVPDITLALCLCQLFF